MKLNIYIGQEQVLMQLWLKDGQTLSELAERVRAAPPTVSKMLQRMEKEGLIRRHREGKRSRVVRVFLTSRGWALQRPVEALWNDAEDELTVRLTHDERRTLKSLLARLQMPTGLES